MNWYGKTLLIVALVLGLGTNSWAGAPTDQLRTYTDQILKELGYEPAVIEQLRADRVV